MHIFSDKNERLELLNGQTLSLDARIAGRRTELERDEKLMEAYSHPGWGVIAKEILVSELNSIARKNILLETEDLKQRHMQQGAYDKVEQLFRCKDVLQADIDGHYKQIRKLQEEQAEVLKKLSKTQER